MQDEGDHIETVSYKYGMQTIPKPSKKVGGPWDTTHRQNFTKAAITFQAPIPSKTMTNFGMSEQSKQAWRQVAKDANESGYIRNAKLFDGKGWKPAQNMHSDQVRTEYRIRYCTDKLPQNAALYPRPRGETQFNWKTFKDSAAKRN